MEPACSEAQNEEDKEEAVRPPRSGGAGDEALLQSGPAEELEEAAEAEEEEEEDEDDHEEEDEDAVEDMVLHNTETPACLSALVSQQEPAGPDQNLPSYGDLPRSEDLNPNPNPNPTYSNPTPTPVIQAYPIDDQYFLVDHPIVPDMLSQSPKTDRLVPSSVVADNNIPFAPFSVVADDNIPFAPFSVVADDNILTVPPSDLIAIITSPRSELHTIPEISSEEETHVKEDMVTQQESEKENLRVHAGILPTHQEHCSRRSLPRLIKNFPPLLPITQQQSMAPPLKATKREQLCRKLPVNEGIKPVNEGIKPAIKMNGSTTPKQRQPAVPVNYRSAIKRRVSNEHNLPSPSSRDNEDEPSQNCSRASIESSPCLRQQGCISLDDVRRFSTMHITSRSNSRLERFSLRGGKIDRVARFAQLQKIWKKDSFVRGIDGEKRPQILHHLFTPTRAT